MTDNVIPLTAIEGGDDETREKVCAVLRGMADQIEEEGTEVLGIALVVVQEDGDIRAAHAGNDTLLMGALAKLSLTLALE